MKRMVAAALVLLPGAAFGQSYQTALPLSPAEKVALEARLSTVLDYAGAGEATDIVLPTGRVANVRTYQVVRQGGRAPCRGYRIDLAGRGSRTAVDGFRCRQAAGAWAIAEPEIVLAQETVAARPADDVVIVQEGAPLDLRGGLFGNEVTVVVPDGLSPDGISPDPLPGRLPDEPLYPSDDGTLAAPAAPPPLPRPAPREALAAVSPPPATVAPEPSAVDLPPDDAEEPAVAEVERIVEVAPPVASDDGPERDEPGEDAGGTTIARVGEATGVIPPTTGVVRDVARTVTTEAEPEAPDYVTDERVTTALQDLDYLPPAADPSPEAVAAAVDEFARDERFALPISADALVERLRGALDRSETVALCGSGESPVCVAR